MSSFNDNNHNNNNSSNNRSSKRRQAAEDEAYAAALQEEYRREFLRRQQQKNKHIYGNGNGNDNVNVNRKQIRPSVQAPAVQVQASAPPEEYVKVMKNPNNIVVDVDADERYARELQQEMERSYNSTGHRNRNSNRAQELQDEEYARRLQNEQQQLQLQRQSRRPPPPVQNIVVPGRPVVPVSRQPSSFLDERMSSTLSGDEETARRIQQELLDAEYAHRLSIEEEQQRLVEEQRQSSQSNRCTFRKLFPLLICGSLVATIPLLFVLGVFDSSDVPFFGDMFGNDWNGDPWLGNTTGTGGPIAGPNALAWPSDRTSGLRLQILNACSDDWQSILAEAIANWDNGSPIDPLTLTTQRVDYESRCSDVTGFLKVCNANYGNTKWRGLNEVMINPRRNTIISSTAKLNEYYLDREDYHQKLYTACHELGHGFGLPHWDEDFFNEDLGNCMDYTLNPSRNSKPDESNFMYLASLYGGRNVTATTETQTTDEISTDSTSPAVIQEAVPNGNDRRRRTRTSRHYYRRVLRHQGQRRQQQTNNNNKNRSQLINVIPYHSQRRILHADERHEVHMIPCDNNDDDDDTNNNKNNKNDIVVIGEADCIKLQQYLLAL